MRSLSSKSSLFLALGLLGLTTACGETKSGVDGGLDVTQPSGGDVTQPSGEDVTQPSGEDVTQSPDDVHQPDVHQPDVHQPDVHQPVVVTKNKSCKDVVNDSTVTNHNKDGRFFIQSADGKSEVEVYCEMNPLQKNTDGAEKPGWTLILASEKNKPFDGLKDVQTPEPTKPGFLNVDLVKHLASNAKQVKIATLDTTKSAKEYVVSLSGLPEKTVYKSPLGNLMNGLRLDLRADKGAKVVLSDMTTWFVGDKLGALKIVSDPTAANDVLREYPSMYWAQGNYGGLHMVEKRAGWGTHNWDDNDVVKNINNNDGLGVYVR